MDTAVVIARKKGARKPVVVVSKKVAPKAADRNFLKRRIRAVLHPLAERGSHFFIIAKPGALDLSFRELREEITLQIRNQ